MKSGISTSKAKRKSIKETEEVLSDPETLKEIAKALKDYEKCKNKGKLLEKIEKELNKEKKLNKWAVKTVRKGRKIL